MRINTQQAHDRAEAAFKKKERQLREGEKAMAEYRAKSLAIRDRTAQLKALRLAPGRSDAS